MKTLSGLLLVLITLVLGSCFDPPEFPNVPEIELAGLTFKEGNATNRTDSLIIELKFKDGDGNLGIDPTLPQFNSYPYNNVTLFQTNEAEKPGLIEVNTIVQNVEHVNKQNVRVIEPFHLLQIEDASKGHLVFPRTKKQPGYSGLPSYDCEFYEYFRAANYAIEARHKAVLDNAATVDTLFVRVNGAKVVTHFVIRDTLYFKVNPKHYNIEVEYLVKDPGNPAADANGFVPFNWRAEFCQQNLDGRFPVLTDKVGPLEGTIRYAMTTIGFRRIFTIKTLKLRIKIRDRDFNESNTVETREFTL
jgi:hypothetical protein